MTEISDGESSFIKTITLWVTVKKLLTTLDKIGPMAHSIYTSLKSMALSAAVFLFPRSRTEDVDPDTEVEPRIRFSNTPVNAVDTDGWMFANAVTTFSPELAKLDEEMTRLSTPLSKLRHVLSNISAYSSIEDYTLDASPAGQLVNDMDLFEGEDMAVISRSAEIDAFGLFTEEETYSEIRLAHVA